MELVDEPADPQEVIAWRRDRPVRLTAVPNATTGIRALAMPPASVIAALEQDANGNPVVPHNTLAFLFLRFLSVGDDVADVNFTAKEVKASAFARVERVLVAHQVVFDQTSMAALVERIERAASQAAHWRDASNAVYTDLTLTAADVHDVEADVAAADGGPAAAAQGRSRGPAPAGAAGDQEINALANVPFSDVTDTNGRLAPLGALMRIAGSCFAAAARKRGGDFMRVYTRAVALANVGTLPEDMRAGAALQWLVDSQLPPGMTAWPVGPRHAASELRMMQLYADPSTRHVAVLNAISTWGGVCKNVALVLGGNKDTPVYDSTAASQVALGHLCAAVFTQGASTALSMATIRRLDRELEHRVYAVEALGDVTTLEARVDVIVGAVTRTTTSGGAGQAGSAMSAGQISNAKEDSCFRDDPRALAAWIAAHANAILAQVTSYIDADSMVRAIQLLIQRQMAPLLQYLTSKVICTDPFFLKLQPARLKLSAYVRATLIIDERGVTPQMLNWEIDQKLVDSIIKGDWEQINIYKQIIQPVYKHAYERTLPDLKWPSEVFADREQLLNVQRYGDRMFSVVGHKINDSNGYFGVVGNVLKHTNQFGVTGIEALFHDYYSPSIRIAAERFRQYRYTAAVSTPFPAFAKTGDAPAATLTELEDAAKAARLLGKVDPRIQAILNNTAAKQPAAAAPAPAPTPAPKPPPKGKSPQDKTPKRPAPAAPPGVTPGGGKVARADVAVGSAADRVSYDGDWMTVIFSLGNSDGRKRFGRRFPVAALDTLALKVCGKHPVCKPVCVSTGGLRLGFCQTPEAPACKDGSAHNPPNIAEFAAQAAELSQPLN